MHAHLSSPQFPSFMLDSRAQQPGNDQLCVSNEPSVLTPECPSCRARHKRKEGIYRNDVTDGTFIHISTKPTLT